MNEEVQTLYRLCVENTTRLDKQFIGLNEPDDESLWNMIASYMLTLNNTMNTSTMGKMMIVTFKIGKDGVITDEMKKLVITIFERLLALQIEYEKKGKRSRQIDPIMTNALKYTYNRNDNDENLRRAAEVDYEIANIMTTSENRIAYAENIIRALN